MVRKLVFAFCFAVGLSFFTPVVRADDGDLVINEIMPYPNDGEEEWIELFNKSETESFDLTGMWIMVNKGTEPNYTYHERIGLSGVVPRQGFLTFSISPSSGYKLPDDGACVTIFTGPTTSIFSLKYGNGTCDEDPTDATGVGVAQGKSINAKLKWQSDTTPPTADWVLDSVTSRGWCDTSDSECFQVSTLVDKLAAEGITSNIAGQDDLSRATDLYFDHSDYGRIAFASEINLTDRDAMSWLGLLDQKLSISQGIISLDADLIKSLVDTRATLTMRNIDLDNPTIRVTNTDGTPGDDSIVSGLSYDTAAQTLTFTAAHFTTFTAVENTSTGEVQGASMPGAPVCGDWPPTNAPNLFQIDTTKNSATLYFTPVNDYLSYYYVAYGYKEGDERFGVQFPAGLSKGVVNYTIGALAPQNTYYFKVRGGNGCAAGPWSNWLEAKTKPKTKLVKVEKAADQLEEKKEETKKVAEEESDKKGVIEKLDITPQPTPYPTRPPRELDFPVENQKIGFWQKILNFFKALFSRQ